MGCDGSSDEASLQIGITTDPKTLVASVDDHKAEAFHGTEKHEKLVDNGKIKVKKETIGSSKLQW